MAQAIRPALDVTAALEVALADLGKDLDFHSGTTRYGRGLSPEARQVALMLALLR